MGTAEMQTPWLTIVGEVADAKLNSPDEPSTEQYYIPVDQAEDDAGALASPTDLNGNYGFIVLRSLLPPEQMENALRSVVRSLDPLLPLTQVQTHGTGGGPKRGAAALQHRADRQLRICGGAAGGRWEFTA